MHRDIKIDNILVKTKLSVLLNRGKENEFCAKLSGNLNERDFMTTPIRRQNDKELFSEPQRQNNPSKPNHSTRIDDFEFKVADLGLAKAVSSPDDWIKTMCGTPVCMAPEIVTGCLYNYKVDVWSVGTLLFHLLTGAYPFKGRNIAELKDNLAKGGYKIPRDVNISFECLDFLNCCLRFDSSKRKDFSFLFNHPFLLTSFSEHSTADNSLNGNKLS